MTVVVSPQKAASDREVLAGLVERVTFQNAENGFCVLRTKAGGHRELMSVVGYAAAISAGRVDHHLKRICEPHGGSLSLKFPSPLNRCFHAASSAL